jgi:hypothetical protein
MNGISMNLFKSFFVLSFSVILTACVSTPPIPIQQPIQFNQSDSYEIYRSPLLDQTNHMLQHLNSNKDILYYQTYGGGGVGVGLLLGPLGVAANIKMIESSTMKDVALLKNKIALDPNRIFMSSADKAGISIKPDGSRKSFKLDPYIYFEKTENDVIMAASVILVDHIGSKNKFQSKYLVQLPITYSISELSSLDAEKSKKLEALIESGFMTLLSRMKSESAANLEAEENVTFVSEFLNPGSKFELAGKLIEKNESFTWIRIVGGVYGVKNSNITLKKQKADPKAKTKKK